MAIRKDILNSIFTLSDFFSTIKNPGPCKTVRGFEKKKITCSTYLYQPVVLFYFFDTVQNPHSQCLTPKPA
jgi:hypothetical protein